MRLYDFLQAQFKTKVSCIFGWDTKFILFLSADYEQYQDYEVQ